MKIKSWAMGIIILVLFFGGIGATSALNLWSTTSTKVPVKFTSGQNAGSYNPADIRGSYTFGEVSSLFNVPLEELGIAFSLNDVEDVALFKNKDLEARYESLKEQGYEVGNGSVKMFVALYSGAPYTLEDDTYLLAPAVDILKAQGTLTEDQLKFLEEHTVEFIEENTKSAITKNIEAPVEPAKEDEKVVKGNTTFQEVLDWGVSKEEIEQALGGKMPNPLTNIRDFCLKEGIEFSSIKNTLQAKIAP
ncbi:MAG: hypothetical protein JM58_11960 [Peptococcaceae bacterium BICA1-8]|nr:MAG: hypothetical protein JM58_11960 [Peptococcaceae bacterium BICA1-8]